MAKLRLQNAALAVIDYQPSQFAGLRSMDHDLSWVLGSQWNESLDT
jgi:hypothetical protein